MKRFFYFILLSVGFFAWNCSGSAPVTPPDDPSTEPIDTVTKNPTPQIWVGYTIRTTAI